MDSRAQTNQRTRRLTLRSGAPIVLGLLLLGLVFTLKLTGCAGRSPAEAESRDTRVTHDQVFKYKPLFSPDGVSIAYTGRSSPEQEAFAIFVVPRDGGEAKKLSPDSLALFALAWSADGKGLYARGDHADKLYYIGLDGSVRLARSADALSGFVNVSADGDTMLMVKFNKDNRDLGIKMAGGALELLAATPAWEADAVFGPGPGEITAVSTPSYEAPVTTISTWSPQTRSYTALPLPEGRAYDPAWSRDGRFLAYSFLRAGQSDLWIYDAKTARAEQVTDEPEDEGCANWSKDGQWLLFCRSSKTSHLFSGEPGQSERRQISDGPALDYAPIVSPDGGWLVFLRRTPATASTKDAPVACVMPVAGGPVRELDLGDVNLIGKSSDAASWSPDSRELAFQGTEGSGKTDIYRIGRDGQGLARVTVAPGDDVAPRWSPDGRYISYTQAGDGRTEVQVIPSSGGLPVVVSQPGTVSEGGCWAPDSDRLAYVSIRGDGVFEVWTAARTHPEKRSRILADKDLAYPLFWSRDGKEILLARRAGSIWAFSSVPAQGGAETRIGRESPIPGGGGEYVELSSLGQKHRDLFYPGGVFVFTDGKLTSDLYLMKVRDLLVSHLSVARPE